MRLLLLALLCACSPKAVQRLSPRDPRLPADAGAWLADAEDEVAITAAKVDDAKLELTRTRDYSRELLERIRKSGSKAQTLEKQFGQYTDARIELKSRELEVAQQQYDLAWGRLKEARAETAVRYDLAVYDLAPINAQVEALRDRVGGSEKYVEEQRAQVQKLAGQVWQAYAQYVSQGGDAIALWGGR
jgi:DNA repair exonuclease SbcCD ATPase subunit